MIEAGSDFVDVIDAASEGVGVFLPAELEMREEAVAELGFGKVGGLLLDGGDEAWVDALESLLETRPVILAFEQGFLQILEIHGVVAVV